MKKDKLITIVSIIILSTGTGGIAGYLTAKKELSHSRTIWTESAKTQSTAPLPFSKNIIADVAEKSTSSVVNIKTERTEEQPFFPFFDNSMPKRIRVAGGSGVILTSNGYILTNQHVIKNSEKIVVTLSDGKTYPAKVVGVDEVTDLSVIKINANNLKAAKLGNSDKTRIGEWVIAVGSPLGLEQSVTQGIISARNRKVRDIPTSVDFLQTDAAINPGNSGGPLINLAGEVIGINTAMRADAQNIGFSIPITTAKKIAKQIIENGVVERPWIGIEMRELLFIPDKDDFFSEPKRQIIINRVVKNGPAEKAGLKAGDILTKIDGKKISDSHDIQEFIMNHNIGENIKFDVNRNGKNVNITIKTEKFPDDMLKK